MEVFKRLWSSRGSRDAQLALRTSAEVLRGGLKEVKLLIHLAGLVEKLT